MFTDDMELSKRLPGITTLALIVLCVSIPAVFGEEQSDWSEVTSTENFTFMLPPGWTYQPLELDGNPIHSLVSEQYPNATFVLSFTENSIDESTADEAYILGLNLFMQSASITPIEGYNTTFVDGAAEAFGTDPDKDTIHAILVPGTTKDTVLLGSYKVLDEALDAADTLREIAFTVTFDKTS